MATRRVDSAAAAATNEEQPAGTVRVAQVLRSFGYRSQSDREKGVDHLWITPQTPPKEVAEIPMEILEQHAKSGFVRFVNVPEGREIATMEDARPADGGA